MSNDPCETWRAISQSLITLSEQLKDVQETLRKMSDRHAASDAALAALGATVEGLTHRVETLEREAADARKSTGGAISDLRENWGRLTAAATVAGFLWVTATRVDLEALGRALSDAGLGK